MTANLNRLVRAVWIVLLSILAVSIGFEITRWGADFTYFVHNWGILLLSLGVCLLSLTLLALRNSKAAWATSLVLLLIAIFGWSNFLVQGDFMFGPRAVTELVGMGILGVVLGLEARTVFALKRNVDD
jgi:hypothetical protein